jgi:hypothetical protein
MNTVNTSVAKNFLVQGFFNSLFYTSPIGLFLAACNFMFEMVRNYYFDWWIVLLPTLAIFAVGNLYTLFLVYQNIGIFGKRENSFSSNQGSYAMSKNNLATS